MAVQVELPLSHGRVALADAQDADLGQFKWSGQYSKNSDTYYVVRIDKSTGKRCHIRLHRVILARMLGRDLLPREQVDHINGDGLDNRRCNLRLATPSQNARNRKLRADSTTGYKGVYQEKKRLKWRATIRVNGKRRTLGRFNAPEDAYRAYCQAATEAFGEYARFE